MGISGTDRRKVNVGKNYEKTSLLGESSWEDRYHCTMVEDGEHLWNCIEYVDLNMVRAGVVSHPVEWTWFSAQGLFGLRDSSTPVRTPESSDGHMSPRKNWRRAAAPSPGGSPEPMYRSGPRSSQNQSPEHLALPPGLPHRPQSQELKNYQLRSPARHMPLPPAAATRNLLQAREIRKGRRHCKSVPNPRPELFPGIELDPIIRVHAHAE